MGSKSQRHAIAEWDFEKAILLRDYLKTLTTEVRLRSRTSVI
ncbi:MAG: hypothetical protein AAB642_02830 [Patescibacteria group bacterium]